MEGVGFWCNVAGVICWPVCFWWMYRISARQEELLKRLHQQGKRIEEFARTEHDLIKEVHPQVGEIREHMQAVAEAVVAPPESGSAR